MPTTYERCDKSVEKMAVELLATFEEHSLVQNAKVRIDFVFAYAERDENGKILADALKKNGIKALAICRKISLKDRALDRGDAEISIDADWWKEANEKEQRALLDHELHHIEVKTDDRGVVIDDLGRPKLRLRKHDVEVGWFKIIAERHGVHSQERKQARSIMEISGQYFWPEMTIPAKVMSSRMQAVELNR